MQHGDGQQGLDRGRNWADHLASMIERVLDTILGLMLLVMALSVAWQVFGRYVLHHAPDWSEEVARFLVVWITMLGAAAVLRSGGHITITALLDRLPDRWARAVILLRDLMMVGCCAVLIWTGWSFSSIMGYQESPALEISMSLVYDSLWIGSALVLLMLCLVRLGRHGDWTGSGEDI